MRRNGISVRTLMIATALVAVAITRADEFETLRLKWRDMITQGTNSSRADGLYATWIGQVESSAQSYKSSLNTNVGRTYLWSTYPNLATDSKDITGSFTRLRAMALGCTVRGSVLYDDQNLRNAIISGLDWMYANYYNPTSVVYDNWFDFEIASPLALNDTVVLLYSNLSPAQINNYMSAVDHFTPTPGYSVISSNLTAANKIWKSVVVGVRGTIVGDSNKIDLARLGLSDVFPYVTTNDGFYTDGSFIFHNYFPYNAGYGVELLDSIGQLMQLLQGSTWQITDPAQTNVFRWVYDSYEPFIVRGAAMEMVDGRYHTRNGDGHERGQEILGAILRIAQLASTNDAASFNSFVKGAIHSDTYAHFVAAQAPPYNVWANAILNDTNVVALAETAQHRQFPGMDRVIHRSANWTFGLAMSSSRVANYESTRSENLKGWFTGDGMTYLYNNDLGHYVDNFWSTIDPYRMPGATVDTITRTNGSGDSYRSPNNQVGGASILGLYGVAAMHLNAYGSGTASARKSWFMFDNEIVCVGNSITSTVSSAVETIIENRRLGVYGNNAFTVNGVAKPTGPGWSETMTGTSWAHLAGTTAGADIGYYFPQAANVKALRESRSGAFKDINTTYGSSTRNTRHYLTKYSDHGTNPSNGTYSYVLLPGMSASAVASYATSPDVTVVQNNSSATCVKENKLGITAVNFWRDTSNYVAGVSSDHKSAVIFRNDGTVLDVGVSDPTQTNNVGINIEISAAATVVLFTDPGVTVLQTSPTIKLSINTGNKFGATLRARFATAPLLSNAYSPVADAYVRNGAAAVTNFGDELTLEVKSGSLGQTRETYMRFDLSSIPGTILNANLRLIARSVQEPILHALAHVSDDSWVESGGSGITWNTKPTSDAASVVWPVIATGQTSTVPVTALAQQAQAADGKLSLRIFSTGTNGAGAASSGFVSYGSKENSSVNQPQLLITYLRTPPTIRLTSPEDGSAIDAPASVTLAADAQDQDGAISLVEFYSGATRVGQFVNPPYTMILPGLGAGSYTFTAVATDNAGLMATSGPVSVSVHTPEPAGRGTGLVGEYYSDQGEFTKLIFTRTDSTVNFNWGLTNPVPGDHFSVRWMGKLQAQHAGVHLFHTETDEGVRLWIDGRLIIDNFTDHAPYTVEDLGSISLIAGRYYNIVMEYFDKNYSAVARLYWTQPGVAKQIIPQSQLYPADQGLRATYFSGTNLSASSIMLTRIDDAVNFFWGTNSPDPTTLTGPFSARWTGKVRANQTGTYSFFTLSDDAVRLWVNGTLMVDNWTAHGLTEDSNTITLVAGQSCDVIMEYFNSSGAATAVLSWRPPGEVKQVIPVANLTPHRNNNPPSLGAIPNFTTARGGLVTFPALASDSDGAAQSLIFSLDAGAPVDASVDPSTGVFSWTPSNTQPFGPYSLTLRVTDTGSPEMSDAQTFTITLLTNLAAASIKLLSSGADWRYLDTGIDQGSAWRGTNFNDTSWKTGNATFGYGVGDESTVTSFGTNAANKYITTYFRRAFYVPDASLIQTLTARLLRNDGAVVYVNGTEVWRDNMPSGAVTFATLASTAISGSNQTQFVNRALSPAVLISGTNIIAVELHQESSSTPDARFDFELAAAAYVPASPILNWVRSGNDTVLTWPEAASLLRVFATTNLASPALWAPINFVPVLSNGQWTVQFPSTSESQKFFRLQTP